MIEFLNLSRLNAPFNIAYKEKFNSFLDKGWYVLGEEVRLFEEEYAAYCGTDFCVGTANGLDALRMIIEGYKILGKLKEGDEVLVCSHTYIATILGIIQAGLKPILVEVNEKTFNFNFPDLARKVTPQTKVIMPTHLYGRLADMERISAFAKAYNLLTVTDAAQSHGATTLDGKRSGSLADASGHSFYPTKNLGAMGDAGAITTDDSELVDVLRSYRNYGFKERYVAQYSGINSRLDELQACFLRIKLPHLDTQNERRRNIARAYLSNIKNPAIILPEWDQTDAHVFHLFVVRCKYRDDLKEYLESKGVKSIIHYPVPPHKQEALSYLNKLHFPITEQLHKEVLSLPIDPMMTMEDVKSVVAVLNSYRCQ